MGADIHRVRAHPFAYITELLEGRRDFVEHTKHRLVKREIDALTFASRFARPQGDESADRAVHSRHVIGERRRPGHDGWPARQTSKIAQAGKGMCDTGKAGL
jgi:hypothetical protein